MEILEIIREKYLFHQIVVGTNAVEEDYFKKRYPYTTLPHIAIIHYLTYRRIHQFSGFVSPSSLIEICIYLF